MSLGLVKDHVVDAAKHAVDIVSFGVVLGALAKFLPAVAALFSIIWTVIRIFETRTVRDYLERRRRRRLQKGPSPD